MLIIYFFHPSSPPPPKLKCLWNKKSCDFLVISNPNQERDEVSLLSSCCWGIEGYFSLYAFFILCQGIFYFLLYWPYPFYIFFLPVFGNLLRYFFLSHSCSLQSFIWLNFKVPPSLHDNGLFLKPEPASLNSATFYEPHPFTWPTFDYQG